MPKPPLPAVISPATFPPPKRFRLQLVRSPHAYTGNPIRPSHEPVHSRVLPTQAAPLDLDWDRFHRARALLEDEQADLLQQKHEMQLREAEVAKRELELIAMEQSLMNTAVPEVRPGFTLGSLISDTLSPFGRIIKAPFAAVRHAMEHHS